ncbi:MAG: patatin-like phospholipase RssA [Orrella sp.]
MSSHKPRIALALGAGAARGWAHVGVIRALQEADIRIDMVCGTSIGSLVGAAYAAGEIDRFERWMRGLSLMDVVSFMDVSLSGGLIKGQKLMDFFHKTFTDRPIESFDIPFAAVATDLTTGAEVWFQEGSTENAVRASMALPGVLTPVSFDGRTLVDGGLVNPVPVSLARAMGADIVIAVDLNADIMGRHLSEEKAEEISGKKIVEEDEGSITDWFKRAQLKLATQWPGFATSSSPPVPSLFDVVASSINIMQVRITRSRMAGDPADAMVTPRLASLGLMDFHRGDEAAAEGKLAVERSLPLIKAATEGY